MGDLTNVAALCLNGVQVTPMYTDGFNVMIQVPSSASVGSGIVRAITTDGRVSTPLGVQVTSTYSGTRVVTGTTGTGPILGIPPGLYTPAPKVAPDPITNVWMDVYRGDGGSQSSPWTLGGTPWSSSPDISGYLTSFGTSILLGGQYDVPHKRITFTITPQNCTAGPPCATWDYIGIFSCWQPGNSVCGGFDPCNDMYDPSSPQNLKLWTSAYKRILVLFPVGDADPQGVLAFGSCP
jgi:hypothetical protein